jgi:nucleoid-associated protein YgaU
MKKQLVILIALIAASALTLGAQSLTENPDYQKSLELKAEATTAFDSGDYDTAADLAAQAKEYAERSDQYVEKMLAKSRADKALSIAKDKLAWADSVNAKTLYPEDYEKASGEYAEAQTAYGSEDYATATDKARDVALILDNLAALIASDAAKKKAENTWPGVYIVRLIPQRRDCLWRIAEYPFIYNNPLKWTVIYEANKKTFRDPGNPNMIYPGQKLVIPSLRGESRDGTYDPDTTYKPFPKKQ